MGFCLTIPPFVVPSFTVLGHGTRNIDDSEPDRDLDSEPEVVPGIACQKGRFGKSPVSLRHGENVQGEPARHVHHAAPG